MAQGHGLITFDGTIYRAGFVQSTRHVAERLGRFDTENEALSAIERRARACGVSVTVQAGTYPRGTRKHGEIIARD